MKSITITQKWIIRFSIIAAVIIYAAIKIQFGLHSDEMGHIMMGHGVLNAGGLIGRDWAPLQFSGIIEIPFFLLWKNMFDSVGLYLFMRVVWLLIQIAFSVSAYFLLKKHYDENKVFLASCLLFLFTNQFMIINYLAYLYWFGMLAVFMFVKFWNSTKPIYIYIQRFQEFFAALQLSDMKAV